VGRIDGRRLHPPPIVGYLLAGVAVGPFTPGFVALLSISINPPLCRRVGAMEVWARARPALAGLVEGRKAKTP
jgi:predicted Kef-type K+ transport protein